MSTRTDGHSRSDSRDEPIDHKTSRMICDAVGKRLQQSTGPDYSPSSRLQELLEELRRRDS